MENAINKLKFNVKTEDNIFKTLFWVLFPAQFCGVAVGSLGSIISGLLVGNGLSETAMAALGFVVPLTSIIATLSSIVYGGARIMCGESIGRGDNREQNKIFSACVYILFALGVVITIVTLAFSNTVAELLGASGLLIEPTAQYIIGEAFGFIPTLFIPCLMVFLQLGNDSKYALLAPCILAGLSLIFGVINLRFFEGGILGIGIADALSEWVVLIIIILRMVKKKQLSLVKELLSKNSILRMLALGFPTALAAILYSLRNSFLNSIALKTFGEEAVAALTVLNSSMGPFDAVNIGVNTVCLTILALYIGMKDKEGIRKGMEVSMKIGIVLACAKMVFLMAFAGPLSSIFGATGTLRETASLLLRLYSLTMPLNIIVIVFVSAYQCTGKVKLVSLFYILNALVFPLGFTLLSTNTLGIVGMDLCYVMAEVLSLIFFYILGFSKGGRSLKLTKMVTLPETKGKYLNFSVNSIEQVTEVSKAISDFCQANGIDQRRSYFCGLCVEELAGNSVEHGFNVLKKKKNYSVDIYLHIEDGTINIRVIDNCPEFNPLEQITQNDDITENIGIRIVQKLADKFSYQCTFGENIISASWFDNK